MATTLTPVSFNVPRDNLYANGYIVLFDDTNEQLLLRDLIDYAPSENDKHHTLKQNQRLDILAWRYYRDEVGGLAAPKYWWVIADANGIQNPFDLYDYIGKDLVIPDLQKILLQI